MKKIFILIIMFSLFTVVIKAKSMTSDYDEVAKSDKVDVTIYAKKVNDLYTDFKIDFQGNVIYRPYWVNIASETWTPTIFYEDINSDGKKELIIILTQGYGTGVLEREVHVFHLQSQVFNDVENEVPYEVLVDDPVAIVSEKVKTDLSPQIAEISIGDKTYTIDIKHINIPPEHLFKDIYFGNIIDYEITDNQLIAKIGGQISAAGGYIGDILITYRFKGKMYQAKSIEFKVNEY